MIKFILTFILPLCPLLSVGQIADWENYSIETNGFIKDAMSNGGFQSDGIFLENQYVNDPNFPYWSGWILSAGTDIETPGITNEHSAIPGKGQNGSDNYAVTYVVGESIIKYSDYTTPRRFESLAVTNSTYAYRSMLDGDQFAKRFGGEDGNDKDYFILTIKGYKNGIIMSDSIDFVLADYRFENNDEDYILNSWEQVDVSTLGEADSLALKLFSSDNGAFGMNTPAYICIDNIVSQFASKVDDSPTINNTLTSSLVCDQLEVNVFDPVGYIIFSKTGQLIKSGQLIAGSNYLSVDELQSGLYYITFSTQHKPEQFIVFK